jgi:glycerol-3-phosphate acyltransferase PlsY
MEEVAAVVGGYLAGSVPFAFLLARRGGVDLRRSGSGNVGAANVLRTRGATIAALAVLLDLAKGGVAAWVALRLASSSSTPVVAGLASVVGHVYPVWLRCRGGKGVATAAGVFIVIEPTAVAAAAAVFAVGVMTTHFVSVGSIAGAMTLAGSVVVVGAPPAVVIGAWAIALLVVHRHRGNLARLLSGTERRVGERL